MIWSCEINYSGWEDDIHHHHFFIEQDNKPSEQEVVDTYNANLYDPNEYIYNERIEPLEDDDIFNWQAIEPDGTSYDNVNIIISPLKIMKTITKEVKNEAQE